MKLNQKEKLEAKIEAYAQIFDEMSPKERSTRLDYLDKQLDGVLNKKDYFEKLFSDTPENAKWALNTLKYASQLGVLGTIAGMSFANPSAGSDSTLLVGALTGLLTSVVGTTVDMAEVSIKEYLNSKKLRELSIEAVGYARAISRDQEKYQDTTSKSPLYSKYNFRIEEQEM